MKIRINKAGCVGHARCAAVAPEIYELGARKPSPGAARASPERIIAVEE